jgi:diaminohydroxyphosphoribosylaminopyrimidine deaminase/5-amino-6-(5-phosphoribosylamino)uracil reductase
MFTEADHQHMRRALEQAERGLFTTTPNPRVGCVVVKAGEVVGEGFHLKAGEPHAEVLALREAGERARGATLYVTLEPCSHHGRTPPCADAVIAAGVKRVVAAMQDPNPKVAGEGFDKLRAAGIEVRCGLLEFEARELNIGFVSRMTRGRPWLRLKVAATLDGRTALANRKSQWITSEAARRDGHAWRARACAVMTGVGTLREDNPRLSVRDIDTPRQPLKVLVDSKLEARLDAALFQSGTVLVFNARDEQSRVHEFTERGIEVITLANAQGKVDLAAMLAELGRRGMNEVHLESGTRLNGSMLREGCVDELLVYLAPKLFGNSALGMFDLPELQELAEAQPLVFNSIERVGADLRILARIAKQQGKE